MTQSVWNCIPTPERGNDEKLLLSSLYTSICETPSFRQATITDKNRLVFMTYSSCFTRLQHRKTQYATLFRASPHQVFIPIVYCSRHGSLAKRVI